MMNSSLCSCLRNVSDPYSGSKNTVALLLDWIAVLVLYIGFYLALLPANNKIRKSKNRVDELLLKELLLLLVSVLSFLRRAEVPDWKLDIQRG